MLLHVRCSSFVVRCMLFLVVGYCLFFVACVLLAVVCCLLFAVCCALFISGRVSVAEVRCSSLVACRMWFVLVGCLFRPVFVY